MTDLLPRIRASFDEGWRFQLGEAPSAQCLDYDDSAWRRLDLPHDWGVEGGMDQNAPAGAKGGFLPTGVGWYRKEFRFDPAWADRGVFVEFDGVYMNADVWINGRHLGKRPYGYMGFEYELTPFLRAEGKNVLAVRVDNSYHPNSRWYTGSGIYRHVWLTAADKTRIAHWGLYATTPEVSAERATLRARTEIHNGAGAARTVSLRSVLMDSNGRAASETESKLTIAAGETAVFDQSMAVERPALWSPDSPNLHTLRQILSDNGTAIDHLDTAIGFRWLSFDPDSGFACNGKPEKMRGVCEHHDAGCVGAAIPDGVVERRLRILKDMGCNAIRTSHNPPSPVLLDLCDRMGFFVMDEAFDKWREGPNGYPGNFEQWWRRDLSDFLKRDRNHPCVVLWSVGNEVQERGKPEGAALAREMVAQVHAEEPTRLVTCGCNSIEICNQSGFAQAFDVAGYNGGGGSVFQYESDHRRFPKRIFVATEVPHSLATRGEYRSLSWNRDSKQKPEPPKWPVPDLTAKEVFPETGPQYCSSYDNASVRISARDAWRLTRDYPFMTGEFRWTGFDYLGETPGWPLRSYNYGVIDTCGFPKDTYFMYRSQWNPAPTLHVFPHWTHPGKEGVEIPIVCYSNCETVELFLDGRSLGERSMAGRMDLVWLVAYAPGEIRAIGKTGGKTILETAIRTAGPAASVKAICDNTKLRADGRDVAHIEASIVDAAGVVVPNSAHRVRFSVEGPARLIGVDNGDPASREPLKGRSVPAFHGLCLAIAQAEKKAGAIAVAVESDGLAPAQIRLMAEE